MQWSKKTGTDEAAPELPATPRAPNAWRPITRAERRWVYAPVESVHLRCAAWNALPGIGLLRDRNYTWGVAALGMAIPTLYLLLTTGRTLYTAVYVGLLSAASHAMATDRMRTASAAYLERVDAWRSRRRNRRPDCPRCGLHNATPAGLCAACEADLAPGLVAPTAAVRAVDGFSFPADPALADYISTHLTVHTTLGKTVRRNHDKLRELAASIAQKVTDLHHEFVSAHVEPLDPSILWVRSHESATLADGTPFVEVLVRRVRWEDGRMVEVWDSARTWFPAGTPSARAGLPAVSMPGAVGGPIGI